jgi:hypothetical protein
MGHLAHMHEMRNSRQTVARSVFVNCGDVYTRIQTKFYIYILSPQCYILGFPW